MTDTCTNCRFGHVLEETHYCRFDPPEFIPPNSTGLKPVRANGWCGKYEKVQKPKGATKRFPAPVNDPNLASFSKISLQDALKTSLNPKP